ncbi:EamA family transporter [Saxibacter everestensis]|uniref:EamA family transporter n=1 Tax=Saxibacter everestensis TaxID=2909229 RepID=A0ABY8QX95_9MICO|nr:EamA family transporter [Brevibacteriaceae bacterium ZFBP1038]
MTARDRLLAISVAVMWGLNFPATAYALEQFPPFLLVALRFALLAVPTVLFVRRPQVKWRWLLGYGVGFGVLQFAFLYLGMSSGMPTGLASLVLQASAPFTVVLAGLFLRERLTPIQGIGVLLAVAGLGIIAAHQAQVSSLMPVVLTLLGALGWSIGNLCSRQARPDSPLRLTLWMSVVPPLPMFALSMMIEGPTAIGASLSTAFTVDALPAVLGVLYIVLIATILGSGIWTTLMSKYPSSTVAPFSMLVPVIGLSSSAFMLGERISGLQIVGAGIVISGVLLASLRFRKPLRRLRRPMPAGASSEAPANVVDPVADPVVDPAEQRIVGR